MELGYAEVEETEPMKNKVRTGVRIFLYENPIFPVVILVFAAAVVGVPNFATLYNFKNLLLQLTDVLVAACGVTLVVLNGGVDFSSTSVLTLGSVTGAYIVVLSPIASNSALSVAAAILFMLALGAAIGGINGFASTKLKMPTFIATMTTQFAFSGIAVLIASSATGKTSINGLPEAFKIIGGKGDFFWVPVLISLLVWFMIDFMLRKTKLGRSIYAIGINQKASEISGVPVKKTIVTIMVISGVLAGIEGMILTGRNMAGLSSLGNNMFIIIIACIAVGGTSTAGGFGGVRQTLLGVVFIVVINNAMNLLGFDWTTIMIIQGIIIIAASFIGQMLTEQKKSADHHRRKCL